DAVWQLIAQQISQTGEPGLLFVDRANRLNNLQYCERLLVTNSCGEQWLPAWGSATLGQFNLPLYVHGPFQSSASFNWDQFEHDIVVAVRFMDDTHAINRFPLAEFADAIAKTRRIGFGFLGLGTALALMGFRYGGASSRAFCRDLLEVMA